MKLTQEVRVALGKLLKLDIPEEAYFDICGDSVNFQANTQMGVKAIRAAFPGTIWSKRYEEQCNWWAYNTKTPDGLLVHIYACYEAPATCKAIEETYEVEEQVPTKFETKRVTKTRVRFDCGKDSD